MGRSRVGRSSLLAWHPVILEMRASFHGRLGVWHQRAWRRGYVAGGRLSWDLALTPAAGDDRVRRRRALAGDEGVARYRDFICQVCATLPCAC
jgi:hypothetical protein